MALLFAASILFAGCEEADEAPRMTLEDVLETLVGREIVDETDEVADLQELARQRSRIETESDEDQG